MQPSRPPTNRLLSTWFPTLALAGATACVPPSIDEPPPPEAHIQAAQTAPVDEAKYAGRVLAITDKAILAKFPFERVMGVLSGDESATGAGRVAMFRQWWDVFNPKPGLGAGAHCDDKVDPVLGPVINGYPFSCRAAPSEGTLATVDPFDPKPATGWPDPFAAGANPEGFIPIGLFNRFDLMPDSGSNCGEYRIVYAKRSGQTNTRNRLLVIFEAKLPNPKPQQGTKGCRKIAELWDGLYAQDSIAARANTLEQFYFSGTSHSNKVIDFNNFTSGGNSGQIRTNQFISPLSAPRSWSFREFKLARSCETCARKFEPTTVKTNPFGPVFRATGDAPNKADFLDHFITQVGSLAVDDVNQFAMTVPDKFNTPQSEASSSDENRYVAQFTGVGLTQEGAGPDNPVLRGRIQAALDALTPTNPPSPALTPEQIVARAQALSCAGCHRLNNPTSAADLSTSLGGNVQWFRSLGFTHVTENDFEDPPSNQRFKLSVAMHSVFLPFRGQLLRGWLAGKDWKSNKHAVH